MFSRNQPHNTFMVPWPYYLGVMSPKVPSVQSKTLPLGYNIFKNYSVKFSADQLKKADAAEELVMGGGGGLHNQQPGQNSHHLPRSSAFRCPAEPTYSLILHIV